MPPWFREARKVPSGGGRCRSATLTEQAVIEGDTLGLSRWPAAQAFSIILPRRIFAGSLIGGVAETQEMLDFCSEHGIVSDIELIGLDGVNEAYEHVIASDVRYRLVIDMATLPAP